MRGTDRSATVTALNDVLDAERSVLLSGQLDRLEGLAREKEQLLSRLGLVNGRPPELVKLRDKLTRNQALLSAAARGARAARDRIAVLRAGPAPLRTYEQDGAPKVVAPCARPGLNRRA